MSESRTVGLRVLARTEVLAAVPAPTFAEEERARVVAEWWRSDGLDVRVDEAGNVWGGLRPGTGPAVVICAHLDTVFGESVDHRPRRDGNRLYGPGVGDNSVAVAALSALHDLLPERLAIPVWIVATVGEEGAGNLVGARHVVAHPQAPIGWMIAVEGNYLGRVVHRAVGSVRWRVEFTGPGGHAWERADAPSAVHAMGALIATLAPLSAPESVNGRRTVNVGRAGGGEAINARARSAWCEVDVRSVDADVLARLEEEVASAARAAAPGVAVELHEFGRRPAGVVGDDHPLVQSAVRALQRAGLRAKLGAASTDANAAYAAGIPAVAVGITTGEGEHTLGEWIDLDPIGEGVTVLANTVIGLSAVGA